MLASLWLYEGNQTHQIETFLQGNVFSYSVCRIGNSLLRAGLGALQGPSHFADVRVTH